MLYAAQGLEAFGAALCETGFNLLVPRRDVEPLRSINRLRQGEGRNVHLRQQTHFRRAPHHSHQKETTPMSYLRGQVLHQIINELVGDRPLRDRLASVAGYRTPRVCTTFDDGATKTKLL
jgi:hypothetical protein